MVHSQGLSRRAVLALSGPAAPGSPGRPSSSREPRQAQQPQGAQAGPAATARQARRAHLQTPAPRRPRSPPAPRPWTAPPSGAPCRPPPPPCSPAPRAARQSSLQRRTLAPRAPPLAQAAAASRRSAAGPALRRGVAEHPTLVDSLNSMPCFCSERWNCRRISPSCGGAGEQPRGEQSAEAGRAGPRSRSPPAPPCLLAARWPAKQQRRQQHLQQANAPRAHARQAGRVRHSPARTGAGPPRQPPEPGWPAAEPAPRRAAEPRARRPTMVGTILSRNSTTMT
jgi:hypothetical protein